MQIFFVTLWFTNAFFRISCFDLNAHHGELQAFTLVVQCISRYRAIQRFFHLSCLPLNHSAQARLPVKTA